MTDLLIVCNHFNPASTAEAVRLSSLVNSLPDELEIAVLSANQARPLGNERLFRVKAPKRWSRRFVFRALQECLLGLRFIRELRRRPSKLVLVSSPPYLSLIMVRYYLSASNRKFTHDLRDPYPELLGSWAWIFRRMEGRLAKKARFTTVCTRSMQRHYSERYGGKVELVENGYDPVPGQAQRPTDKLRVAVLGNMGPFQNIGWLSKLAAVLKDLPVQLDVIGSGSDEGYLKNAPNVQWHHRRSLAEARQMLRSCHIGLNLRTSSAWNKMIAPVRTYEYIGAGLPQVMVPRTPFFDSLEQDGLGWVYDEDDMEGVIARFLSVLKEKHVWETTALKVQQQKQTYTRSRANDAWRSHLMAHL